MSFLTRLFNRAPSDPAEESKQLFLKAVELIGLERLDEALALFDQAIAAQPNNVNAWSWKGVTLDTMGKPDQALPCLEKACELIPADPTHHFNKAKVEAQLHLNDRATASFLEFLRIADPKEHSDMMQEARQHLKLAA
jgi:tetratricopeptide (TPR) repeat protein